MIKEPLELKGTQEIPEFETHDSWRHVFDFFFLPILNNLPTSSIHFFKKNDHSVREVVEHKTTHHALEKLYHKEEVSRPKTFLQKIIHYVWFESGNSKGVRNRLRIVKKAIETALKDIYLRKKEVVILSIASGSARAVIESVVEVDMVDNPNVRGYFLDKNPRALEYSKKLALEKGLDSKQYQWIEGTANTYLVGANTKGQHFDIVEMVGLLDYFDDQKTVELCTSIFNILNEGGVFVVANINHNKEMEFVTKVIGWPMHYKTPEHLEDLLIRSGFKTENLTVNIEPLEIHTVVVAKK